MNSTSKEVFFAAATPLEMVVGRTALIRRGRMYVNI
jgi:hypothetical protein